jgi:hypothetical protein
LAWRLKNNFQLHHPEDATATSSPPDQSPEVCESPDPISPEAYMEGVEMDRSKGKLAWRARPRWRDCRVKLGRFAKYEEAAEAVKQFFIQRWGSWDDSRPWLRKPAALAVVRVIDGWHDLEFPEGVDRDRARRAAAIVLTMEPYEMWVKAERALRRALAQIAE